MNIIKVVLLIVVLLVPAWVHAKPAPELVDAVQNHFPSSDEHKGLVSSQHRLEMSKVRGFAVVKKPDIPAGTAFWFITKQHYDFRPFIVKGDKANTFFGKPDVLLEPGVIMVVVSTEVFGKTVQIKLLSVDVITERGGTPTNSDSRAAVAMTFKFPGLDMSAADIPAVLDKIQHYIMPASSLAQANQIALAMRSGGVPVAAKAVVAPAAAETPPKKAAAKEAAAEKTVPVDQLPAATPPGMVRAGMTYDEVKAIKGKPISTITRSGQVIFDYNDHEVIFVQDKVHDIRWK